MSILETIIGDGERIGKVAGNVQLLYIRKYSKRRLLECRSKKLATFWETP